MDGELMLSYGIDYDKGLKNCMDNLPFYKKILSMFLKDPCFMLAKAAYQSGDLKEFFSRMHELKGISGNAALTDLYEASIPLVDMLRKPEDYDSVEADRLFTITEEAYYRTCQGITLVISEVE